MLKIPRPEESLEEGTDLPVVVCALYKFVALEDYRDKCDPLLHAMNRLQIYGTLLLAHEGINGTVAGSRESINQLLNWLMQDSRLADIETKEAYTCNIPFKRTRVKLKKEIVTMGVEDIDPRKSAGTYIEAKEWNELILQPDVLLIDTRNEYEIQVGTFKGAVNPRTQSFRQFPEYVKKKLNRNTHKKVAMFCTGGIRCEKSTAFLKQQGFDQVYHLKGGILKYLEDVPEADSLWQGECFVFDERVTVNHRLEKGRYDQCHACRLPITDEDKKSEKYQQGVSCPHCYDRLTPEQKARFSQREKQVQLARVRGEQHMGKGVAETIARRRTLKALRRRKLHK